MNNNLVQSVICLSRVIAKVSSTVLRGEGGSDAPDLPDQIAPLHLLPKLGHSHALRWIDKPKLFLQAEKSGRAK